MKNGATISPEKIKEREKSLPAAQLSPRVYKAVPQLARLREQVLVNDVWQQPEMSYRDRILVTCGVLAATGKLEELQVWMGRAVQHGVSLDELRGLIVQVTFYAGWPAGLCAGRAAIDLFEAAEKAGE